LLQHWLLLVQGLLGGRQEGCVICEAATSDGR